MRTKRFHIYGDDILIAITFGGWGYRQDGFAGLFLYPALAFAALWLVNLVHTLYMVRRYYWHNEHRTRWNAFGYLHGWWD